MYASSMNSGGFIVCFFNCYFKWCLDANTFYYQVHYIELYTVFLIKLNVFHVAWRVLLWVGNVLLQAATGQPQRNAVAGGQIAQIPEHKSSGNLTILLHGKKWTNLAFMIFTHTHTCTHTNALKWTNKKRRKKDTATVHRKTVLSNILRLTCIFLALLHAWRLKLHLPNWNEVFVSSCVHGWNRPLLWPTDAEES